MKINPKYLQLFIAFLEILFPFIGYWFWNWNILETSLALLIEILITLTFFMLKCFYHVFQKQFLLHYFKSGNTFMLYGVRLPGVLLSIALIVIAYLLVFGIYSIITFQALVKSIAHSYEAYLSVKWSDFTALIGEDAWTYIYLGITASVLLKVYEFILYCRKNVYDVSKFIWLLPPEYMQTKQLKILAGGGAILAAGILLIASEHTYCHLIIYAIALLHLFYTFVKTFFQVKPIN